VDLDVREERQHEHAAADQAEHERLLQPMLEVP